MRSLIAVVVLALAMPFAAQAQTPTITVVRANEDTVWVWVGGSGSHRCYYDMDGIHVYRHVLSVTPCPLYPPDCNPDADMAQFTWCDPIELALSCHKTYAFTSSLVWCLLAGDCVWVSPGPHFTWDPVIPGCEKTGPPLGACCIYGVEGWCVQSTATAAAYQPPRGGIYVGDGTVCQPSPPCVVSAHPASWGKIKVIYR